MDERAQRILRLALHPATPEGEAIAAFNAARRYAARAGGFGAPWHTDDAPPPCMPQAARSVVRVPELPASRLRDWLDELANGARTHGITVELVHDADERAEFGAPMRVALTGGYAGRITLLAWINACRRSAELARSRSAGWPRLRRAGRG